MVSRHEKPYGAERTDRAYHTETGTSRRSHSRRDSEETGKNLSQRTSDRRDQRRFREDVDGERERPYGERRRHRSRSRSPGYASNRRSRSPALNHPQHSSRRSRLDKQDRFHSPERSSGPSRTRSPKNSLTSGRPSIQQEPLIGIGNPSITKFQGKSDLQQVQIRSKSVSPDHLSEEPKDEPNFQPSGKLAAETKNFQGVVLKYHEPPEARKPSKKWRLYVFKLEKEVDLFHIHNQSAYLFGRDRVVVDIPIDHPSSSKQHAVIQYRQVSSTNEFGDSKTTVKPFIIDLESANGTFVNQGKIPVSRYYELQNGDVIKFGFSTREYVLILEP